MGRWVTDDLTETKRAGWFTLTGQGKIQGFPINPVFLILIVTKPAVSDASVHKAFSDADMKSLYEVFVWSLTGH